MDNLVILISRHTSNNALQNILGAICSILKTVTKLA